MEVARALTIVSAGRAPSLPSDGPVVKVPLSEAELETRWELIAGDRERLLRLVRHLCADSADAEDCVHDAFLRAIEMDSLDATRLYGLLTTIARNRAADSHRRQHRQTRLLERLFENVSASPDEIAEDRDEAIWLAWKATSLPTAERRALAYVAAGYEPCEAARLLGLTPNSFRLALSKARAHLKKIAHDAN